MIFDVLTQWVSPVRTEVFFAVRAAAIKGLGIFPALIYEFRPDDPWRIPREPVLWCGYGIEGKVSLSQNLPHQREIEKVAIGGTNGRVE